MRVTVERIEPKDEEELIVRCYDPGAAWVSSVKEAASGHRTICGWQEDTMHRLRLTEIFYFEVVDDRSFLYTQAAWMTDPFSTRRRRYSRRKRSCMSLNGCARAVPCFAAASP